MRCLWLTVILGILRLSHTSPVSPNEELQFKPSPPGEDVAHSTDQTPSSCGYKACNPWRADLLNVHIVCHTHTDPGWLKTADQYYYGSKKSASPEGVQYILDSVTKELHDDDSKSKRFVYSEMSFFTRWWREQDRSTKAKVTKLVNEGRLEFVMGGWVMNDEAASHYNTIIDQESLGFRFLNETFGACGRPRSAWQIDPFGHSREQASILAQLGYDGLFFGRLDYQDKETRLQYKTMEMMWMASPNLGGQSALFAGALFNLYLPPEGFCFDLACKDDPIMDDERLHDYNVDEKVDAFIAATETRAKYYKSNHIMMTFGEDYQYQNANAWYKNIDKLIKYVNARQANGSRVNVLYSTPSCYIEAKNQANLTWSIKRDDFLPYASQAHTFWTGYFTSRPTAKRYSRYANNLLQVCKQLDVLAEPAREGRHGDDITVLKEALAVMQTHDGISGTEKQVVADDFNERVANGLAKCQDVVNSVYDKLLPRKHGKALHQEFCHYLNVSYCNMTERSDNFTVTLYNPVARPVTQWIRVPVAGRGRFVLGPDLKPVDSQEVPLFGGTVKLAEHNGSIAEAELAFRASIPALGFATYFVVKSPDKVAATRHESARYMVHAGRDATIMNQFVSLTFDGTSGLLKSMTNLQSKVSLAVEQNLLYYRSFAGNNSSPEFQSSGAYVFRPESNVATPVAKAARLEIVKGPLVQEVRQVFSDWASQVFRLHNNHSIVEVEWIVGPIPFQDGVGREVISRYTTDLRTNGAFYTDANGRGILKRVRNHRDTWILIQTEQVSGNYFPVNSRIFIRDENRDVQLTVLTDRSQGGASINDGELELMIHRRCLHDDNYGVNEALNETGVDGRGLVAKGTHYLLLDNIVRSGHRHRNAGERIFMAPWPSFADLGHMTVQKYSTKYATMYSGLRGKVPENVRVLTLENWRDGSVLLRLEHFFEWTDDQKLSAPAIVFLQDLFAPFTVVSVQELTLGANQFLNDARRFSWQTLEGASNDPVTRNYFLPLAGDSGLEVTLFSMQIRTFKIFLRKSM